MYNEIEKYKTGLDNKSCQKANKENNIDIPNVNKSLEKKSVEKEKDEWLGRAETA